MVLNKAELMRRPAFWTSLRAWSLIAGICYESHLEVMEGVTVSLNSFIGLCRQNPGICWKVCRRLLCSYDKPGSPRHFREEKERGYIRYTLSFVGLQTDLGVVNVNSASSGRWMYSCCLCPTRPLSLRPPIRKGWNDWFSEGYSAWDHAVLSWEKKMSPGFWTRERDGSML